jgi:hypothetical protein
MAKKIQKAKYDVVLTNEGLDEIKKELIGALLSDLKIKLFRCLDEPEPDGYFLRMKVANPNTDLFPSQVYDLWIPLTYVAYVLSSADEALTRVHGF